MLNNIFDNKTVPIILIALLPIGLLISSGVSELLSILIVIFYIIHLIFKKDYSIINNSYFKLLLILKIVHPNLCLTKSLRTLIFCSTTPMESEITLSFAVLYIFYNK